MVRVVEAALGEVVREAEGRALYEEIESARLAMVAFRESATPSKRGAVLRELESRLARLGPEQRTKLARAYTLYLELVNVCENAYRTQRLRERAAGTPQRSSPADVIFVLTAHPTESRSTRNIAVLRRLRDLLTESADRGRDPAPDELRHLLHLLWRVGTHPRHRPSVADEASHLFSLVSDPILDELIDLARAGRVVRLRTWVGGDKDGHPGVGPRETESSLQLSRNRLLGFVRKRITPRLAGDARLLDDSAVLRSLEALDDALSNLVEVRRGDGGRIAGARRAVRRLDRTCRARLHGPHPALERLGVLLDLFPGLVVPLELREERGRFRSRSAIASMLARLAGVAEGGRLDAYVEGVVVSMVTDARDLSEAANLVERVTGGPRLPVIPLFELPETLERSAEILEDGWRSAAFRRSLRRTGASLEVMLGYSDTAKRMGVLASRVQIGRAMQDIGAWARGKGLSALFFHGSGGSVGRGGGSFEDRAAGWPEDALRPHKETLQGEMIERTLATPEILRSNVAKIAEMQNRPPRFVPPGALSRALADESWKAFVELVERPELRTLLSLATPYDRLGTLAIGSRPVSRAGADAGGPELERLRAIPWVLCWTQTRYLLHAWLGAGSAWRRIRREPGAAARLRREVRRDPLLRAYIRTIGFTLAKTAPVVWERYVATLAGKVSPAILRRIERERRDALDLARSASPDGELLHDRRWLLESIRYRAPMIHPLNLLQIGTLKRARAGRWSRTDDDLFRETVTGIAAGMLTTG